jgi:Domain of Unknown Function (DUF1206)
MTANSTTAHNPVARVAAEHPNVVKLGRIGWLTKGIIYVLAGGLALLIVTRSFGWSDASTGNTEASPTGAIKSVAHSAGGPVLLVLLAIGLFLYAAWRIATAVMPGSMDAESTATRIGYLVSAFIYAGFGLTAVALARSPQANPNGNTKVTSVTGRLMEHTGGRWLIGIAGAVTIGAGLYRIVKGMKQDVTKDVDTSGMSAERVRWIRRLGAAGEVGRGIAIGIVGFFLLRAAFTVDANQATGLDGALRRFASNPWGVLLVALVGIGFVAYGLYCLGTFTRRRLRAP